MQHDLPLTDQETEIGRQLEALGWKRDNPRLPWAQWVAPDERMQIESHDRPGDDRRNGRFLVVAHEAIWRESEDRFIWPGRAYIYVATAAQAVAVMRAAGVLDGTDGGETGE